MVKPWQNYCFKVFARKKKFDDVSHVSTILRTTVSTTSICGKVIRQDKPK